MESEFIKMKIDKEKLLNDLQYVFGDKEYFETIKRIVENQQECDKWISVNDDMPKEYFDERTEKMRSAMVLAACKFYDQEFIMCRYTINGEWDKVIAGDVTHWMKIENPKEKPDAKICEKEDKEYEEIKNRIEKKYAMIEVNGFNKCFQYEVFNTNET